MYKKSIKHNARIENIKVLHTGLEPKCLKRFRSGSFTVKIEGNFEESAKMLGNDEYFGESKKVGNKFQKLEGMGSDFKNFSTGTSQKLSEQKKQLTKSKQYLKIKELTPIRDLEIDDNSDAEKDCQTNGSANMFFELDAMATEDIQGDV